MQTLELIATSRPIEDAIFRQQLSESEKTVLFELLTQSESTISSSVTPTITRDELTSYLEIAGNACIRLGRAMSTLKPIIGQMLLIAKNRPEMQKEMGYSTFTEFVNEWAVDKLKLSRATIYDCIRLATAFPSLGIDRYEQIGGAKMQVLLKAEVKEGNSNCEDLLKAAENPAVTADGLRDILSEKGLGEPSTMKASSIRIICDEITKNEFNAMLADDILMRGLQLKNPGDLFQAILAEATSGLYEMAKANLGESNA